MRSEHADTTARAVSTRLLLLRWFGWLLLATIAFELVIATRYFDVADFDRGHGALAFRAAMLVAHFSVLSAVLLAVVLALVLLRAPVWLVVPVGTALSTATLLALLIDTQVYQLYRFHINAGVMNLLLGGAAQETFDFSRSMYLQAAAIALAIVLVQSVAAWLGWRYVLHNPGSRRVARALALTLFGTVVTFHAAHIWADATGYAPLLEQTDVLPLRYAATAKRSLRALGVEVHSQPTVRSRGQEGGDLVYPLHPLKCRQSGTPPNIIVILIDSWRRDALNAQVTPNLDRFSRRGVRFMDHHSGGNATRIGVFSLFYSIPGTYWHRMLAEREGPVFITALLERRYDVRAFRSAPLFSPEFDRTVFADVASVRLRSEGDNAVERDRDLTSDFTSFLASRPDETPFFALLFYDSAHKLDLPRDGRKLLFQPSAPEVNYLGLDAQADPLPMHNRYRNSLHYVDSLVGEVLAEVEARGLLENSVIVVTGDHGQEFNDNRRNYWGHGSNFTRFQTGVPLLFYSPRLAPASHSHRTTHFDVVPTLMREYLDCDMPFSNYSVGRSLFEPGERDTLVLSEYSDFAIVTADRIAVIRKQGMEVRDTDYSELEGGRLAPDTIEAALEQKSRFYRRAKTKSK